MRLVRLSPVNTCPGWVMGATQRWRETSTVTFMRRKVRLMCDVEEINVMYWYWSCLNGCFFYYYKVYVRKCIVGKGEDYRGKVFTTRSGLTCQQWWSKFPHDHRWDTSSHSEIIIIQTDKQTRGVLWSNGLMDLNLNPADDVTFSSLKTMTEHENPPKQAGSEDGSAAEILRHVDFHALIDCSHLQQQCETNSFIWIYTNKYFLDTFVKRSHFILFQLLWSKNITVISLVSDSWWQQVRQSQRLGGDEKLNI